MSSMTLLQEEIWWRRSRAFPNFVGAPEADPRYNIQVLAEGDGTRNVLRITFAVAGFSVDGLVVALEDGGLSFAPASWKGDVSSGASGSATGSRCARA